MEFITPSEADTQRFLTVYNQVAEQSARHATRFGLDGLTLLEYARRTVARHQATGSFDCAAGDQE